MKRKNNYYKKYPWKRVLKNIQIRCNNPNHQSYKYYGEKGIKCLITEDEIKFLWFRDRAYNMKKPSIDRKNSNKNYTLNNCQFIEMIDNSNKSHEKAILQFDLEDNFIKEWKSAMQIERTLKIGHYRIGAYAKGKLKTCGKFIWKYKDKKNV